MIDSTAFQPSAAADDQVPEIWSTGDVILDLYEVKEVHEGGGMGLVYRVHHRGWNVDLAVKSPRPEFFRSENDRVNFEREAETWVKLGMHPHIVSCFYVRRLGGIPRIFAEYVTGGSLLDWIQERKLYAGGPDRALERILDLAIQFAWGLQYAHEQGLVHQDVKPANVLLTAEGTARLTDFGLAKSRAGLPGQTPLQVGRSLLVSYGGMTPAYCSPEQAGQQPLSFKTDIWSWAVSVLEMFTGEVTWRSGSVAGEALSAYREIGSGDPDLPEMPPTLADLLQRCLTVDPKQRPASMLEIADALRQIYQQNVGRAHGRHLPAPAAALADSLNNRAISLFDLNRREEAEQNWQEALRVQPHHPEATYNAGLIQWRSARSTDLQLLTRLHETSSSCADPEKMDYLVGLIHLERNDCEAALQVLDKAAAGGARRTELASAAAQARAQSAQSAHFVRALEGQAWVLALAWSSDGRFALSSCQDNTLQLWDVLTGRRLRVFQGHTKEVYAVAMSPDGKLALSGSAEFLLDGKQLRLWDVASGQCLGAFRGHTEQVRSLAWCPDGRRALSSGNDKTLRLWEVPSGRCVRVFEGHTAWIGSVACSPDGRFALSGGGDRTLRLWEIASGRCLRTFEGHREAVRSVAWSHDGSCALTGSFDETLRFWDVSSGRCLRVFEGHTGYIDAVACSPDGRFALCGCGDRTVKLWEISSGRCLRSFEGHTHCVTAVAFNRDGRYALSGSLDNSLRLWSIPRDWPSSPLAISRPLAKEPSAYPQLMGRARQALERGEVATAVSLLAQARLEPGCQRRPEGLDLARKLSRVATHRGYRGGWEQRSWSASAGTVRTVALSPDGRLVLSAGSDKSVRLWEVSSGRCLSTLEGHTDEVRCVAWSPDGRCALSRSKDATLRLWEIASGRCLRVLQTNSAAEETVVWSPDGRFALSGSRFNLRLWDAASGRGLRSFDGPRDSVCAAAWSPDGRFALGGSGDHALRLWDIASGQCLREFDERSSMVLTVAWSPDGRFAFSGFGNGFLLWEIFSSRDLFRRGGPPLREFKGHGDWVQSVAWSPDGRFALSASNDKTVRLWEVAGGQCLRTLEGHAKAVRSVAWGPDGRFALSGGDDGTLRVWELDWDLQSHQMVDWHDGARPYLKAFLANQTPYVADVSNNEKPGEDEITQALTRLGKPTWTEAQFQRLITDLGGAGYGWLRPEGVRRELEKMAASWQGPF